MKLATVAEERPRPPLRLRGGVLGKGRVARKTVKIWSKQMVWRAMKA